ncbi:DNA topoisomerase IB [Altericroceibacterium xinjiangense]|uniref:DNA topoisomerase IB n=1 Tax=Altericroceibacterium xinjiangense TaxID=762261 RepID=UPI0019D07DEF|nr:DNA topoisomerase IB [Altericroceibacterium xinjiangense]
MIKSSSLVFVHDHDPGITRKKSGKGWVYYDAQGARIKDADEVARLNAVALPPAYTGAWYCPDPNGHLLATGIDDRGRKQYRYHPEFRILKECEKFDACVEFGKRLPRIRKRVEQDLASRKLTRERAIANVVRLLDLGAIRIGNESYARKNKSFGATTLRRRHVSISGKTLSLRFKAKSGKLREVAITDQRLIHFVRKMEDLPGQHLFQYIGDDGEVHPIGSSEVNAYLGETMGEHFTAKNFRTWHASALAFCILAEADEPVTIKALMEEVSAHLGNTPAIARKSYVHPSVVGLVQGQEEWRAALKLPRKTKWLSREERGLIRLLETCPCAEELLGDSGSGT